MARVEGVEEPLGDFGLHVGGQEDEGRSQNGEDLKAHGVAADYQGQGVLQAPAPERREIGQHVDQSPQPGLVPAQVENQSQDDSRVGVVRIQDVDGQHPDHEPPPLPGFDSVDGQQAEKQGDKDVPVGQIFPEVVGVEGQGIEGLGDDGENGQPPQIPLDVVGVHEAHRQAVAEDGEGQPSHPPESRVSGEKDGAHVVHHHA